MALTTYTEILDAMKRWAQNDTLGDEAYDDFLRMTEAHLDNKLRVQTMTDRVNRDTVVGSDLYALPDGSRGIRQIKVEAGGRRYSLKYLTPEALADKYGWVAYGNAPEAYTLTGLDIELKPIPNDVYSLRILYYRKIPELTAAAPTNWVLERYPQIYLYGGLHFMAEYTRDDEAAGYWGNLLAVAMQTTEESDAEDRWSGSTPAMVAL